MDHVLARRDSAHFREVWWWSRDRRSHGPLCSPDRVRLWSRSDGHVDRELSSGGLVYERSVGIWTIGNHAGVCIEASQTP